MFRANLCDYNLTLQYPQPVPFSTLAYINGSNPISSNTESGKYKAKLTKQEFMLEAQNRFAAKLVKRDGAFSKRERIRAREAWERSLAGRANGTIDSWYGCDIYDEMLDYAINFTFPWSTTFLSRNFDHMLIADMYYRSEPELRRHFRYLRHPRCLEPRSAYGRFCLPQRFVPCHVSLKHISMLFCPDPQTRAAIHAPTSKDWVESTPYPFGNSKHAPAYPNSAFINPSIDYSSGDPSMFHPFFRV